MAPTWALANEAPDTAAALRRLEERLNELQEQMREKDRRINELEGQVRSMRRQPGEPASSQEALEQAVEQLERDRARAAGEKPPGILSVPVGGASQLRLIDISLDVLFAVGSSTERDESLQTLQGGGHDPRKRGFTLQQAELSFTGAVDPYLYGEAHVLFSIDPIDGETISELEEAFMQTQTLPWGLQLEAGYFFTEFGLINPKHPHEWDWLDQPVINTRVFGPDGLRQAGARLGWLTPLPWYSELHLGVQNSDGHTAASFRGEGLGAHGHGDEEEEAHFEETIGGRPIVERETRSLGDLLYLLRWVNGWDLTDEFSMQIGGSALYGPNNTGGDAETWIYGGDLLVKWRPVAHDRGWPFITWQTEVIGRDFEAAAYADPDEGIFIPADTLSDWGLYTQLLYGFHRNWAGGLRYEYASGSGASYEEGERISRSDDPFRDDRHRISPLLLWQPTEFSRFRLQYNYDIA
ncbi:MAG TPA: hypothetical protein VM754_07925, partial [Actinomycetota bacterium]|nr:hypothetical protein [Actinomycetota bacterium]